MQIDTENMFLRIYPDGTVYYSTLFFIIYYKMSDYSGARLSLTCSCHMDLTYYPLDVQLCDFDLISYAFTTKVPVDIDLIDNGEVYITNFRT
jgi:hypothetical protein